MKSSFFHHAPRHAFTLIELLTVIAIIGILAAIIIPVVGKVRQTARQAQGLSNIRQVGMALLSYAHENRGRFPAYNTPLKNGTPAHNWSFVLHEHVSGVATTNASRLPDWFFDPMIDRDPAAGVPTHFAIQCFADPSEPAALNACANINRWRAPARLIMAADTGLDANGFPHGDLWGLDGNAAGWTGANGSQPDYSQTNQVIAPGSNQQGDLRWDEEGKAKFVFGDGHVARLAQAHVTKSMVNPLLNQ